MKELLIETLAAFGYPIFLQGSMNENEAYPESFFTFWNNSADDMHHYDNEPIAFEWDFDVNFYSTDPTLVNSVLVSARNALRAAGFAVNGKGHDVASDEPTHTGRGLNAKIREENENENEEEE